MNIAILGFGTVGSGVYEIIKESNNSSLEDIKVLKILDLPRHKQKLDIVVFDIEEIINDKEIDLVVETIGGIHPAYEFIMSCLKNKKHVVTANKAVVAAYLQEFLEEAKNNGVSFLFEASTGGGIPWISSIKQAKRIDNIDSFYGIFNGTSNFILDYMYSDNKNFNDSLELAKELGYAESDPSADINGYDVQNKLIISSAVSFNAFLDINSFPCFPMSKINFTDIQYLKDKNLSIKYIGEAKMSCDEYEAFVMPTVLETTSLEANVPKNFNLLSLNGETIGCLKFYGQGAGKLPTANAIIQDILDIKFNTASLNLNLDKVVSYNDSLFDNKFLIRTNFSFESSFIESIDEYEEYFYIYTKSIKTKDLMSLAKEVIEKDENALIAKIGNFM